EQENRLQRLFIDRVQSEFSAVLGKLDPEWLYGLIAQYTVHKLFGPDRLLKKYLSRPEIKRRSPRERDFLQSQLFSPWRFSFMQVEKDLGSDFFEMRDVLTDEGFLLFSPAVDKYEAEQQVSFYFTLLFFNGQCRQTYGPILAFTGLQPFDLLFYAGQLQEKSAGLMDVEEMTQKDPLPFMMLALAGNFPLTYYKQDLAINHLTELEIDSLNLEAWRDDFKIEEKEGVYQLNLKRWRQHPHFAHIYFAPSDRKFTAFSATERGWDKLVAGIKRQGLDFPCRPDFKATMAGAAAVRRLLDQDPFLSPYAAIFEPEISPEKEQEIEALNHFFELLIPYLNAGEEYDLAELARKAGIDRENAALLAEQMEEKLKDT
ncbi:MAG: hypothetical protein GX335_04655, partial [Firmicutes bacterium]|nr:hypothetical protein [Bacillota bacterium]